MSRGAVGGFRVVVIASVGEISPIFGLDRKYVDVFNDFST